MLRKKKSCEQISEHMIFGFQNICHVGWDSIRNSEWVGKNEVKTPDFMIYCCLIYNKGLSHEKRMEQCKKKYCSAWELTSASESQFWHVKLLRVMLLHFKWNGLWHLLHSMELFMVSLAAISACSSIQISTSSFAGDCDFFIEAGGSFGLCSFCGCLFLRWLLTLFYSIFLLVLHIIILRLVSVKISDVLKWCEISTFHWPMPPSGFFQRCTWHSIKYFSKVLEHSKSFSSKCIASHSVSTYMI